MKYDDLDNAPHELIAVLHLGARPMTFHRAGAALPNLVELDRSSLHLRPARRLYTDGITAIRRDG